LGTGTVFAIGGSTGWESLECEGGLGELISSGTILADGMKSKFVEGKVWESDEFKERK
jgi:hypothetical protein